MTKYIRLAGLIIGLASGSEGWAQASATLRGRVIDPSGAALEGARIQLRNALIGLLRETVSGTNGAFELANIPFQSYELLVEGEGFAPAARTIALRTTVPVSIEVALQIEDRIETVDVAVSERATLIDAEATGTRSELSRATIERMPVQVGARGLEAVLLNFPGFAANANGAIHPRGAHNQMTYVIDGMPISDQFTGSFATSIDPSLVQTIELYTGDVPAEYGAKVSGVANITTRSGFDAGGKRFGTLELGGAGYDTASTSGQAGGTAGKLGWFAALSALKSNRFLDTPSLDNLHNGGNSERGFARLDWQASEKNIFRVNAMAGRSSFQLANLRSQHANGQQQRRLLRDAAVSLGYVRMLSAAATFDSTTSYRTTIAQLAPSEGGTPVTASLERHLSTVATFNRLNVIHGRHTLRLGADYQHFPLSESFAFALTSPGFNDPAAADFNPNLLAHDLTRGGDWFRFASKGSGSLATGFAQDKIKIGRWMLNLGARFDRYAFLVNGSQLQPRLGVAYHIEETGTVFRASYNRNYQTPPNENLLLSSSQAARRSRLQM
ncbi:MAG: TonB-dependent receptor [Bryobacterales bacterium]